METRVENKPALPDQVGPYRIERRVGVGGMGEVYRAFDERLHRSVALKLIRTDALDSTETQERFRREARMIAGLSHPALVQIHDLLDWEGRQILVMEFIEGRTLAELVRDGPLPWARVLRLGQEIAEGLVEAHEKGIIHRDLKTENVIVTHRDRPKILDFGLAKHMVRPVGEASISATNVVLGTCRTMSPEQARGEALDVRSDLFSLGILFYEISTAVLPFDGGTAAESLTKVCIFQPAAVREVNPRLPEGFSRLVERLLEKEPSRRPQSAGEVLAALRKLDPGGDRDATAQLCVAAARSSPEDAPAVDPSDVAAPPGAARRWLRTGARRVVAVVLAAAAGGALGFWRQDLEAWARRAVDLDALGALDAVETWFNGARGSGGEGMPSSPDAPPSPAPVAQTAAALDDAILSAVARAALGDAEPALRELEGIRRAAAAEGLAEQELEARLAAARIGRTAGRPEAARFQLETLVEDALRRGHPEIAERAAALLAAALLATDTPTDTELKDEAPPPDPAADANPPGADDPS